MSERTWAETAEWEHEMGMICAQCHGEFSIYEESVGGLCDDCARDLDDD